MEAFMSFLTPTKVTDNYWFVDGFNGFRIAWGDTKLESLQNAMKYVTERLTDSWYNGYTVEHLQFLKSQIKSNSK
jgi:hypothetical protein